MKAFFKGLGQSENENEDKFYDSPEAFLHPDASTEGGIAMRNKALIDQQRSAILEMVKEMGKKLLTGNPNLMSISMPVKLFEPRSYLQKLTDVWVFPDYLHRAASSSDPAERMRLVVTYILAGFQFAFASWKKPFNPILGETWQAHLDDGTEMYLEQVSHHPPVSAFQMLGPNRSWEFDGASEPTVSYKGNSLKTKAKGYRVVRFRDGSTIQILYPSYYLRGVLYSSEPRGEITGVATFLDYKNQLRCSVEFGSMKNASDPILRRSDAVQGVLVRDATMKATDDQLRAKAAGHAGSSGGDGRQGETSTSSLNGLSAGGNTTNDDNDDDDVEEEAEATPRPPSTPLSNPNGTLLGRVTGSWLSHVDWDAKRYWTFDSDSAAQWHEVDEKEALPSDCRYREDLDALKRSSREESQKWKEVLEQKQRRDAKMRKGAA